MSLSVVEVSRGVLDALTAGIVVLDDAGGVRFVNAAFRRFAQVLPADHPFREACTTGCDFLGLTRRALTRPGFGTLVADGLAAVLAGREAVFTTLLPVIRPWPPSSSQWKRRPQRKGDSSSPTRM